MGNTVELLAKFSMEDAREVYIRSKSKTPVTPVDIRAESVVSAPVR